MCLNVYHTHNARAHTHTQSYREKRQKSVSEKTKRAVILNGVEGERDERETHTTHCCGGQIFILFLICIYI